MRSVINDLPIIVDDVSTISVPIDQFTVNSLSLLIKYLEGLQDGSGKHIPGLFELTMHYRSVRQGITDAKKLSQLEDDMEIPF